MTPLAKINLGCVALSLLAAVLVANDYPIDAADAARHTRTSELWLLAGMFFWIGFCITFKTPEK